MKPQQLHTTAKAAQGGLQTLLQEPSTEPETATEEEQPTGEEATTTDEAADTRYDR